MSHETKTPSPARLRLEASRQRALREIAQIGRALESEVGWLPALKTWGLPLIAFAAGVGLALGLPKWRERKGLPSPR